MSLFQIRPLQIHWSAANFWKIFRCIAIPSYRDWGRNNTTKATSIRYPPMSRLMLLRPACSQSRWRRRPSANCSIFPPMKSQLNFLPLSFLIREWQFLKRRARPMKQIGNSKALYFFDLFWGSFIVSYLEGRSLPLAIALFRNDSFPLRCRRWTAFV